MKIWNKKIILLIVSIFVLAGCGGDGSKGEVSLESLLIIVPDNISPIARANKTHVTICQSEAFTLNANQSTDEDGIIAGYEWQLANGTVLGNNETLNHSLLIGNYKVRLIVTDDDGATGVAEIIVTVKDCTSTNEEEETTTTPPTEEEPEEETTTTPPTEEEPEEETTTTPPTEEETEEQNPCMTHNGTEYCPVTSPHTGKVWLDRNLGAARACESFNDTACYGDYYQWGRNADGHEDSTSAITNTQAINVNSAGAEYIYVTDLNLYDNDWAQAADGSGSLRKTNWSKTDGSSVCPVGFRVPSASEVQAETLDATTVDGSTKVISRETAFTNFLKLPSGGDRGDRTPVLHFVGVTGGLWTSSTSGAKSYALGYFIAGTLPVAAGISPLGDRANGFAVRCLK